MSVQAKVARGMTYLHNERGNFWLWAAVCDNMAKAESMSNEDVGEQFNVAKDTVRNARLALTAYHVLRDNPKYRDAAKILRKNIDKSNWEIAASHYDRHQKVDELFRDLWTNVELSARELRDTLSEKYDGPALLRSLSRLQKQIPQIRFDISHELDVMKRKPSKKLVAQIASTDRSLARCEKAVERLISELQGDKEPF